MGFDRKSKVMTFELEVLIMTEFKFCPVCGGRLKTKSREGKKRLVCSECSYTFYQNSKPCTAVLVEYEGKLMLTRRGIEPFKDWWDLPGGFIEDGEHPEDGAVRELEEETGLDVEILALLGVEMDIYGTDKINTLNFHYLARPISGDPKPASDVAEIRWFSPDEIPENIAFENCRHAVETWKMKMRMESLDSLCATSHPHCHLSVTAKGIKREPMF
jgi:8-oxo-dGTP diphosphatase